MKEISPELLNKYLNNECTTAEQQQVEAWLEGEKKKAADLPDPQIDRMEASIWEKVGQVVKVEEPAARVIPLYKRVTRYAAAVILLFTTGFFAYDYLSHDSPNPSGGLSYFEDFQSVKTKRGEKRTVTLSDGSTIRMNYETEIKVPEQFEGNERVVYLTGHAHFDVAKDTERPFIIYTQDSKTQVLGTSFDINTKRKGETEIIVTSGKVAFSEKDFAENGVTLTVNDRAMLKGDNTITTSKVEALKLTAWKENQLVFDDLTLENIIQIVEPWYDVVISVDDPELLTTDYNLDMDNPSLEQLMGELSFLGDFQYFIEEKNISIY
ncbi:MAG: FecR domain-containing protein [Bacteroidota bacterium]